MDESSQDTPIHRATIDVLPIDVLDEWLSKIRDRRLVVVNKLASVRAAKKAARLIEISEKYSKLYDRIKKSLSKLDEDIEKNEININKLRALELELHDDIEDEDDHDEQGTDDNGGMEEALD